MLSGATFTLGSSALDLGLWSNLRLDRLFLAVTPVQERMEHMERMISINAPAMSSPLMTTALPR